MVKKEDEKRISRKYVNLATADIAKDAYREVEDYMMGLPGRTDFCDSDERGWPEMGLDYEYKSLVCKIRGELEELEVSAGYHQDSNLYTLVQVLQDHYQEQGKYLMT